MNADGRSCRDVFARKRNSYQVDNGLYASHHSSSLFKSNHHKISTDRKSPPEAPNFIASKGPKKLDFHR